MEGDLLHMAQAPGFFSPDFMVSPPIVGPYDGLVMSQQCV